MLVFIHNCMDSNILLIVAHYAMRDTYPEGVSKNKKRATWKRAVNLVVERGKVPNYPCKRSFKEVGDHQGQVTQKVSITLMPCRVVYEKATVFYFTVRTVPPSVTATQQTTFA